MGKIVDLAAWRADSSKVRIHYVDAIEPMSLEKLIAQRADSLPSAVYLEDGSPVVDPAIFGDGSAHD